MTKEDFVVLQSDLQKSGKPGGFSRRTVSRTCRDQHPCGCRRNRGLHRRRIH